MTDFFAGIPRARFDPDAADDLAYRHYDPDRVVAGKRLEDHLRFSVAWWHAFAWPGGDPFGGATFERPWFAADDMAHARLKADAAFEMFAILGQPFFAFHDADIRPEGATFAETTANLDAMVDHIGTRMEATGTRLLWGTANLFTHRRYMAGAATNPDPDVFAHAAATVKTCLDATHRLGGANYVLWGGREGYETLLNTDLARERQQAGRFLCMVVDYARKIGFDGAILIEPKPQEPTKHQYDHDVATVHGFLQEFGLERDVKVNVEQGHAILAGHSFEHELALAASLGLFGSIDMNRNDQQSGWDTDQFPERRPRGRPRLLRGPPRRRLHHRRHQLRRQAPPPVAGPRRPDRRPCRRDGRLRARAHGGGGAPRGRRARARADGALRGVGRLGPARLRPRRHRRAG